MVDKKELRDLRGGEKRMWLRIHRDEVLEYLEDHGEEATKEKYHLKHDTLDRVIRPEGGNYPRFTRYDRLEMKVNMAKAKVDDLTGEVRELKEQFAKFQESVGEQLKQSFLLPLLRAGIRLPPELLLKPGPDYLNVKFLLSQASGDEPVPEEPGQYDVVAEAEEILDPEDPGDLEQKLHAADCHLLDLYISACKREDWKDALCMYLWMANLDCLRGDENETPEGFIEGAREWLARAKKPDQLSICYPDIS